VPAKPRAKPTRASQRARWINPGLSRHKQRDLSKPPTFKPATPVAEEGSGTLAGDGTEEGGEDGDRNEDAGAQHAPENSGTQEKHAVKEATNVHILDLHTENPVVSYGGQIFSCQWAQNIGTELLFTAHDPDASLPVLRTLPGDVDLLAASSVRIISKSVVLEPKLSERSRPALPPSNTRGLVPDLKIPVGAQASTRRKDQARFLERMMEIKEAKGEDDLVTVFAQKRQTNSGWRAQFQQKRQQERARLQRVLKGNNGRESLEAKRKLEEMYEEDENRKAEENSRGIRVDGKKLKGPGRKSKIRFGMAVEESKDEAAKQESSRRKTGVLGLLQRTESGKTFEVADVPTPESGLIPIPQRWSDLGEEEIDGDGAEDGLFDEDGELCDGDAPGEDEDAQIHNG